MDLMLGGDLRYYLKRKPKGFDEGTVQLNGHSRQLYAVRQLYANCMLSLR